MSQMNRGLDWWLICLGGYLTIAVGLPALLIAAAALWGAVGWVIRWAWWGLMG